MLNAVNRNKFRIEFIRGKSLQQVTFSFIENPWRNPIRLLWLDLALAAPARRWKRRIKELLATGGGAPTRSLCSHSTDSDGDGIAIGMEDDRKKAGLCQGGFGATRYGLMPNYAFHLVNHKYDVTDYKGFIQTMALMGRTSKICWREAHKRDIKIVGLIWFINPVEWSFLGLRKLEKKGRGQPYRDL